MSEKPQERPGAIKMTLVINRPHRFFMVIAILFIFVTLMRNLWISDDAFIGMRTVDNFVNGYGLVWNVGERVQVFTNPLWMFLQVPFYLFTHHNPFSTLYVTSTLASMATVVLLLTQFSTNYRTTILVSLVLCLSMAFIDYSSSGLENPLTHLLLVLLLIVLLKKDLPSPRKLLFISLLASLAALNRLDSILFFIPALVAVFLENYRQWFRAIGLIAAAFAPLLLWLAFATFYYGFPFPNTYYVKAATGLQTYYLLEQGAGYFRNSFHWDPITLTVVTLALLSVLVQRQPKRIAIGLGIVLYLFYVLWVGGDFMSGRFFSGAFLLALGLLLTFDYQTVFGTVERNQYLLVLLVILLVGLSAQRPPMLIGTHDSAGEWDEFGVANEKLFYFPVTGWVNHVTTNMQHDWMVLGTRAKQDGQSPVTQNAIGMFGYYAGPEIYVIDSFAIPDPLRARIPVTGPSRVGHYDRRMPLGYEETLADGFQNHIQNSALRQYYDKIKILIRADLCAPDRLETIINFNLGSYDYLVDDYVASPEPK